MNRSSRKRTGFVYVIFKDKKPFIYSDNGIYFDESKIIYIGKTMNIKSRMLQHFNRDSRIGIGTKALNQFGRVSVYYVETETIAIMNVLECVLINHFFPMFNGESKYNSHAFTIPKSSFAWRYFNPSKMKLYIETFKKNNHA